MRVHYQCGLVGLGDVEGFSVVVVANALMSLSVNDVKALFFCLPCPDGMENTCLTLMDHCRV